MAAHAAPALSQRDHWYAYPETVPLHVPLETVSCWPSCGVPPIEGGALIAGATGAVATTPDCAEVALVVPAVFVAKTVARSVRLTSAEVAAYAAAVAPEIAEQAAPVLSQRDH